MPDPIILGTIGLDDVKTPFGEVKSALGGSSVYSSIAASFFSEPGIIAPAGQDLPKDYEDFLKSRGISLKGVVKKGKNFRWQGYYEYDMNEAKTINTELNSLADFDPKIPEEYKKAKFVFLANIDPEIQIKVLKQVEDPKFVMIDSMNFWIEIKREKLLEAMSKADAILLNEGEARMLFKTPSLVKAGRQMLDLGVRYAIIKKGEHGSLLFSDNSSFSAPGYPLEDVVDPTGAGDSFAGAIIGYLSKTQDISEKNMRKAIVYGSTIASFNAEGFSVNNLKTLTMQKIEKRFEEFRDLGDF